SDANFRQAHLAVREFHNMLFRKDEYDAPEFRPLRLEVLQKAANYYRGFQQQVADDPELSADVADAYYHLGGILQADGDRKSARDWFERSLPLWEQTVAARPDVPTQRVLLMRTCNRLAALYRTEGRFDETLPLYQRSLALIGTLSDDGRGGSIDRDRAAICSGLEKLHNRKGEYLLALDHCLQWVQIDERLCDRRDAAESDLYGFGGALRRTAQTLGSLGRTQEAANYGERSCAVLEKIVQRDALTPRSADSLAHSLHSLGPLYRSLGRLEDSLSILKTASTG
ncbi:MAG: tetratricopeptide repeat protein, partial [Planctomycetes bacterium]|nr:tetratricopeptide repeat protein [Planctomycetota bacterium]